MGGEAVYDGAGTYVSGPDERYRVPDDLSVTPFSLRNVLIVGSCFGEALGPHIENMVPGAKADVILFNHAAALPPAPPQPAASYDCQVLLLPLREMMHEHRMMRLPGDDAASYEAAFAESARRLHVMLDGALGYYRDHHMLTFVGTFMTAQQNGLGRLMPRRDLRNPTFYVEELNRLIAERIDPLPNAYVLDLDAISANFGRRHMQDDASWLYGHGTVMDDWDHQHDQNRIEPPVRASALDRTQPRLFARALWQEVTAMVKTVRQVDQVKLVAVDLDDTLWRGVIAEVGVGDPALTEGWPIALAEALIYLKRRGILLALVSKNTQAVVEAAWDSIFQGRLTLDDFAVRQINWQSKAENIGIICRQVNLLPRSVVFIDDNPAERAAVQAAYPDVRVLGANPLLTRRILLWAPETQVATLTAESGRRTESVRALVARESTREALSRADFLASLQMSVEGTRVTGVADAAFARAIELVNKSNQFNTTGQRWTREQAAALFAEGGCWHTFQVADRFSRYGLVGVAIVRGAVIEQFVMSCRVVGMEAEIAMLAQVTAAIDAPEIRGVLVVTDANLLARDLYERAGFTADEAGYVLKRRSLPAAVVQPEVAPAKAANEDASPWRRLASRVTQRVVPNRG